MLGAADCREGRNEGQWEEDGGSEVQTQVGRKGRKEGTEWREELDIHEDLHGEASRRTRLDLLSWIHSELLRPQSPPPELQWELRTSGGLQVSRSSAG